jgi:hypothetical protein
MGEMRRQPMFTKYYNAKAVVFGHLIDICLS